MVKVNYNRKLGSKKSQGIYTPKAPQNKLKPIKQVAPAPQSL